MTKSKSFHSSLPEAKDSDALPLGESLHQQGQALSNTAIEQANGFANLGFRRFQNFRWRNPFAIAGLLVFAIALKPILLPSFTSSFRQLNTPYPPLAMTGGDPYVRALMRTISASESNDSNPYGLLYGGEHFSDLSDHPDRCIPIANGPNQGSCSTAAGRYQFITSTWEEKAQLYHPKPDGWLFWQHYPYDPVSQDTVVYKWLTDSTAWDIDIPARLREGKLDEVLYKLSGTWTSLGYGIETNDMTPYLDEIYQKFLHEERKQPNRSGARANSEVQRNVRAAIFSKESGP
jgi:muramidase (phage lysozyme)